MTSKSKFPRRAALTGAAAASLLMTAPPASALGLGRLSVQSALGESLRAEIEVTSMTPEEASNLRIRVAPPESYRAANVDYNPVLPSTKAVLERRADGRQFVRLTSDRGVQEPFVDVILEISWASGRLVREYTLLFDPPATLRAAAPATPGATAAPATAAAPAFNPPIISSSPASPPVAQGPSRAERRAAARQAAAEATAASAATEARAPAMPPAPAEARARAASVGQGGGDNYRVRAGDSLSRIAARTQRPGVSLDQMLVALYRANPQAFIDNNMNRLRSGVVLSVPSAESAQALPAPEAHQVITAQSADFGAYRQRLAGAPIPAQPEGSARQASGKVEASVDDRKQAAAPTGDKLRLQKGSATGAVDVAATAQAERISKERERADASAQVAELSRNVKQLQQISGGASAPPSTATPPALTGQASPGGASAGAGIVPRPPTNATPPVVVAQAPTPPAMLPAAVSPAPAPSAVVQATPAPAAVATAAAASAVGSTPAEAASASLPGVSPASSAALASAPASAVVPRPAASRPAPKTRAPEAAPSAIGSMMEDNPTALGVGGLLVALLAGFGIYRFVKRSKKDSGETSFLESRLQPDSFFGASGGQRIDTRDAAGSSSSMTYSLSQLDAIGDVDPVAEADVYLAYGRDLQAEEILKEAMRSNPERLAIRIKLLEVYAKRRDTKGFEQLAIQLFALTHGEGEDWLKVQELGAEIDPDNPLFRPGGMPTGPRQADAPEPLGASTLPQSVMPVPSQFGQSLPAPATADSAFGELDLDLDNPAIGTPTGPGELDSTEAFPPDAGAESASFETPTHKMPLLPQQAEAQPDRRDEPLAFDLSGFSLDLDKPPAKTATAAAATMGGDDEIDLPFIDVGEDDAEDPMVRKLELAEEFRQIGDRDGARDLLREVLSKASGTTRSKAQGMLDDLG